MKHLSKLMGFATLSVLLLAPQFSQAQGIEGLNISGSVDTYFRANLNTSSDPTEGESLAPLTSFADSTGFALGMVNLIGSYEKGKVGAVADLVYGPRGEAAVFASSAPSNIVNQLYAYWNVSDKTTLTIGNFNTFLGYEVISPTGNFNYSTSHLFSYGPFSHTGLKADFSLSEEWSFMAAVMNPTDATTANPTGEYVGGAQIGYSKDAGSAYLNGLFSDGFYQVDLTTGWDLSEKVFAGLNASSSTDFYGAALYLQAAASDDLKLGVRGEYFEDDGLGLFGSGENVFDATVSANYSVGNLTIIPEFRMDVLSTDGFVVEASPLEMDDNLSSFILAAVFAFD